MKAPVPFSNFVRSYTNAAAYNRGLESTARGDYDCAIQKTRDYARAISDHERAVALQPDYSEAHYNLALDYFALGNYDRAVARYT